MVLVDHCGLQMVALMVACEMLGFVRRASGWDRKYRELGPTRGPDSPGGTGRVRRGGRGSGMVRAIDHRSGHGTRDDELGDEPFMTASFSSAPPAARAAGDPPRRPARDPPLEDDAARQATITT